MRTSPKRVLIAETPKYKQSSTYKQNQYSSTKYNFTTNTNTNNHQPLIHYRTRTQHSPQQQRIIDHQTSIIEEQSQISSRECQLLIKIGTLLQENMQMNEKLRSYQQIHAILIKKVELYENVNQELIAKQQQLQTHMKQLQGQIQSLTLHKQELSGSNKQQKQANDILQLQIIEYKQKLNTQKYKHSQQVILLQKTIQSLQEYKRNFRETDQYKQQHERLLKQIQSKDRQIETINTNVQAIKISLERLTLQLHGQKKKCQQLLNRQHHHDTATNVLANRKIDINIDQKEYHHKNLDKGKDDKIKKLISKNKQLSSINKLLESELNTQNNKIIEYEKKDSYLICSRYVGLISRVKDHQYQEQKYSDINRIKNQTLPDEFYGSKFKKETKETYHSRNIRTNSSQVHHRL